MTGIITVPISNGKLDGHFGHCKQFAMIHVEGNTINEVSYLDAPPHQPGLLPRWLEARGTTYIIAGGMGQRAQDLFKKRGIDVHLGAPRLTPEELARDFLQGVLSSDNKQCHHK